MSLTGHIYTARLLKLKILILSPHMHTEQSFRHSAASCLKIILKVRFAEILLERHL